MAPSVWRIVASSSHRARARTRQEQRYTKWHRQIAKCICSFTCARALSLSLTANWWEWVRQTRRRKPWWKWTSAAAAASSTKHLYLLEIFIIFSLAKAYAFPLSLYHVWICRVCISFTMIFPLFYLSCSLVVFLSFSRNFSSLSLCQQLQANSNLYAYLCESPYCMWHT